MRVWLIIFFMALCLTSPGFAGDLQLTSSTVIRFASLEQSRRVLGASDGFTSRMSKFDREARMLRRGEDPGEAEFLKFAASAAHEWSPEEKTKITEAVRPHLAALQRLKLSLPAEVLIVKTSGNEEGGAAYSRANAIVLPEPWVASWPAEMLGPLVVHELFHVMTRHDPALRSRLYALIGFKPCGPIEIPAKYEPIRITNPDSPVIDHYISVTSGAQAMRMVPLMVRAVKYVSQANPGPFIHYISPMLLEVEEANGKWRARERDGKPSIGWEFDFKDFQEQTGRVNHPMIQAEEILAGDFEIMVARPQGLAEARELINKMLARQTERLAATEAKAKRDGTDAAAGANPGRAATALQRARMMVESSRAALHHVDVQERVIGAIRRELGK